MSDLPSLIRLLVLRDERLPFLDLDLADPDSGDPLGELCLTGANGCGKSTLLARLHEVLTGRPRWPETGGGYFLAKFRLDGDNFYVARASGNEETHLFRESIETSKAWASLSQAPPAFDELPGLFAGAMLLGSSPALATATAHWFDSGSPGGGSDSEENLDDFLDRILEARREAFHRFLRSPENREKTVAAVEEAFESTSPHSLPLLREGWSRLLAPAGFSVDLGNESGPFFDSCGNPVPPGRFGDALKRAVLHLGIAATRPSDVIFLDLPETGLHPGLSRNLIDLYRSLFPGGEDRPLLAVTTHCPLIASSFAPSRRFRLERLGTEAGFVRIPSGTGSGVEEILCNDFGLAVAESETPPPPAPKEDHPSRIKRAIRRSENEDELADLIDEAMTIGKSGETGR